MIFLSYTRQDRDKIVDLSAELNRRRIATWWDLGALEAGLPWEESVKKAIQDSSHFLVCVSKALANKPDSFVYKELEFAKAERQNRLGQPKWVVPILLDDTRPPQILVDEIDVSRIHGLSASSIPALADAIAQMINNAPAPVESSQALIERYIPYLGKFDLCGCRFSAYKPSGFFSTTSATYVWTFEFRARELVAELHYWKDYWSGNFRKKPALEQVTGTLIHIDETHSLVDWRYSGGVRRSKVVIEGTPARAKVSVSPMYSEFVAQKTPDYADLTQAWAHNFIIPDYYS